jgi:hypothetical protein
MISCFEQGNGYARSKRLFILFFIAVCAQFGYEEVHAADFSGSGDMSEQRYCQTATRLPNGKVLITGGFNLTPAQTSYSSSELYDPYQGLFSATGSMSVGRDGHTATLLPDGNALITGGYDATTKIFLNSAELYNSDSGEFFHNDNMIMAAARRFHTATLLENGKVLIAGGAQAIGPYNVLNNIDETYDPHTETFTPVTENMTTRRRSHAATRLRNGKVLITGGWYTWGGAADIAEIYSPAGNSFAPLANAMQSGRYYHTATLLANGKTLLTGGNDGTTSLDTAELYDPESGVFTYTSGKMTMAREQHAATLLSDGTVLITGGRNGSGILSSAELYDPDADTFSSTTGNMTILRYQQTSTMLNDGRVLITGGGSAGGYTASSELFNPSAYLGSLVKLTSNFGSDYWTVQGAYDMAIDNDGLMARNIVFSDSGLILDRDISVTLIGGFEDGFSVTNGYSSISGAVTIRSGRLTIKNIILK